MAPRGTARSSRSTTVLPPKRRVSLSVRMIVSRTPGTSTYDATTRTVRFVPARPIAPGVHFASVHARDKTSHKWLYRVWTFQVSS